MAGQKIIIELEGDSTDRGDVRMHTLIDKLDSVKKALDYAEKRAATGGKRGPIYYRLVDLHHSLPTLAFEPVWTGAPDEDRTNAVVYEFRTRIAQIRDGKVPEDVSGEELEAYGELAPQPDEHLRRVNISFDAPTILRRIETFEVTRAFHDQVEDLLGPQEIAWGTMTGTLEAIDLHLRNRFTLYPVIGPTSVRCSFDRDLRQQVVKAIEHYVQVYGKIHYRRRYKFPQTMSGVYRIDLLDDDPLRPRLSELRGIAPEATDGIDTREFVDGLDEEW